MSFIVRLLSVLMRVLTFPFRLVGRAFGGTGGTTARKALGSAAATDPSVQSRLGEKPEVSMTFPFRALERPRLAEQSASELTLDIAESFVGRAHRFYSDQFNIFPKPSLFYEEVELEEVAHALAADDPDSTDARFVLWMDLFRRTLNDNARRLLMVFAPLLFAASMAGAITVMRAMPTVENLPGLAGQVVPSSFVVVPVMLIIGLMILTLIYQWPYKVINQRNLLGLDNYITSRFSRINQNFQVAKRFALNVERNKRMSEADALKYEAGIWTVAYNWFAMRLYLCERVVRNQMYQVARNASLYAIGGVLMCFLVTGAAVGSWMVIWPADTDPLLTYGVFAAGSLIYMLAAYTLVLGGAPGEAGRVLSDNEWFRFGGAELDRTIAEHVGEDKLQIVTFRDRNRME